MDKEVYEIITVLIQLHEMRLSTLLRRLFNLLESISRASQSSDRRNAVKYQQSQLLVLRLIALGMFYHWHQIYAAQGVNSDRALIKGSSKETNSSAVGVSTGPSGSGEESDAQPASPTGSTTSNVLYQPVGTGYHKNEYNHYYPNPLEEPVAKRAFSLASEYFRHWSSPQSIRLLTGYVGYQSFYMYTLRATHTSQSQPLSACTQDIAIGTNMLQHFVKMCLAEPIADLNLEIQEAAGAIFTFVSATNWNVAVQRAKSCLYLVLSRGDEVADLTDINFLEYASIDISRLAQIIEAFSDVFPRVKPSEQLKLAIVLRRVVWAFIYRCNGTFIDMYRNMYRPSTNRIEPLIDCLHTIIDSQLSRTGNTAHPAFYQLLVMLIVVSPDSVALAAEHVTDHGGGRENCCSKTVRFIGRIRQQLVSREVPEACVLAAMEISRVVCLLFPLQNNPLGRLLDSFKDDLNAVLLDCSSRFVPSKDEPTDPPVLMIVNTKNMFQAYPEKTLKLFWSKLTVQKPLPHIQLCVVNALHLTFSQESRTHWSKIADLEGFVTSIGKLLYDLLRRNMEVIQIASEQHAAGLSNAHTRAIGLGTGGRRANAGQNGGSSNASASICDLAIDMFSKGEKASLVISNELVERVFIVTRILGCIASDPDVAISGANEDVKFGAMEQLVNVIATCIQEPSFVTQRQAGLALRSLFNPALLAKWVQSADITFAVWTLSLQVIQNICRALVHSMVTSTMVQHRQLLEIMYDMLVLSNSILEMSAGVMGAAIEMAEYPQFEVAFEVVILMHLWADDREISQLTHECIRLKIRAQEIMVGAGVSLDPSTTNHRLYRELEESEVKKAGAYSRLAQMRAFFRTIRKHMRPTAGAQAAWQETYKLWRQMLQVLVMREETTRVPDGGVPLEREPSNASSVAGNQPSTVGSGTANTRAGSSSRTTEKEEKREQHVSRRRNVFEKLTGQSGKHASRNNNAATSGDRHANTTINTNAGSPPSQGSIGMGLVTGNIMGRVTAGSVSPTQSGGGNNLNISTSSSDNLTSAMGGAGMRANGQVPAGAQLPAIAKIPSLSVSELRVQWRYCTGFLLAAGGAIITDGPMTVDRMASNDAAEMHSLMEHFIGECLKLIVSDDIQLRELTKEGLSNKTHPGIYMLFLDGCLLNMKRFMQPTGEVNVSESRTLFVSQCISIIESLVDRDITDSLLESATNIDFSHVLQTMCKYLGAASLQTPSGALHERIRFTRLVEMFLQSRLRQSLAQEVNLRNDLLETFVNWVTELHAMDPRNLRNEETHQNKVLTDLTISTMRALIQVLAKLPVKPINAPASHSSTNQPTDVRALRSRAYRRYFDFFVRFMSQCRMVEIQEFGSMTSAHATHTAASAALGSAGGSGSGGSGGGSSNPATATLRGRSGRSDSVVASSTSTDVGVGRDIARNIYSNATSSATSPTLQARYSRELSQNAELLLNISIKALTNMLAANLEIGLQYSLSVIYHEDTKLRGLFTDMFTTILNQGIDIDSLGGDTPDHWKSRLVEALVDPNLKLLLGINEVCQVQDIDELGASLINIFENRHQCKIMFERIITVELERTDSAAELFRRNCLATRLLTCYAKIHGEPYLKATLMPALRKLLAQPPGTLTFELNPNKMGELADRDRNLKNVERLCSLVIDSIVSSVNSVPPTLRWICNMIYRVVITRFPDAGYTAVGGFVFLRFLCPALVAPDSHGICATITNPEIRRGLLLCTKITHNLANDIQFGNKETYMVPLNKFITENRARTMRFLSEIAELSDDIESIYDGPAKSIASSVGGGPLGRSSNEYVASETDSEINQSASDSIASGISSKDFLVVQRFIFDHLDRLDPYLSREPMVLMNVTEKRTERRKSSHSRSAATAASKSSSSSNSVGQKKSGSAGETTSTDNLFTQVSYVMRQLGPPVAPATEARAPKIIASLPDKGSGNGENLFYDILRRDANRNTDSIAKKAIVYLGGVSREKRPVIYVIARRMQMQYLDMDAVMLHILRLLEPLNNKSFELFFDLTQFGPANEVPAQWLRQMKRIIPESIVNNVQSVYWYNVNSYFRRYVKQANLSLPLRVGRRSVFPHSLHDLHEFLASPQADLPPGTVSLDNDNGVNISPVNRISRTNLAMPCMIKITPEAVQITALRRQEVFGLSTYFNDVYHITEIVDLQITAVSEVAGLAELIDGGDSGNHKSTTRSALHRTASRSSEGDRPGNGRSSNAGDYLVSIRFEGSNSPAMFTSPKAELMYKAIRSARSRYNSHAAVPSVQERAIRPADVPGTLLNVALLNCGSENATLRISAYRMLISVVATFNIDVGHELAFASDLCLPPNPLQFIHRICTKLSSSAPDMTLELLSEALLAFTKSQQNMKPWILHYMQPWLQGLGQFTHNDDSHPDALNRTKDIIRSLIRLQLKEPTMYMHFKEHVWSQLSCVEELTDLVLDIMVTVSMEYGAMTVETELVADMLATVSGKNPRYNKIVPRLRKLVAQTCTMSVTHISTHQLWSEIAVYLRLLLTVSFSNCSLADEYLPDVAFISCMLLKAGPGLIQATLHGIVMHVVHSLALTQCNGMIIDQTFSSSITGVNSFAGNPVRQLSDEDNHQSSRASPGDAAGQVLTPYAQLAQQMAELIQPRTKLNFGLKAKATSAVTFIASSYTRGGAALTLNPEALMEFKDELNNITPALESPRESLAGVERVAQIFLRIMDNPAFANGRGNSWRARFTTLVTSSAFVFNPAIQPRAFVLLGKLTASDEVDDDLLYQTLATLRGALASFGETDESLPASVLLCLVNMVGNLPSDSSYLASLFWVAIATMEIGHVALYKVGLSLMCKVVRTLNACGAFKMENGNGFQDFLMAARTVVEKPAEQIDDMVGINFRSSFPVSLSLLLLRGIMDDNTKDEAYEALILVIIVVAKCRKWQQSDKTNPKRKCDLVLPYLITVLPTASGRKELGHVFTRAGFSVSSDTLQSFENGGYIKLMEEIHKWDISRNCQSDYVLYPSIVAAMLHASRTDHDILILYSILASGITWADTTMSLLVIESLASTMSKSIRNSSSAKVTHKLHDIMVRIATNRPNFDPDMFIQQQALLQGKNGGVATLSDIAGSLTLDAVASTTAPGRKSASQNAHMSTSSSGAILGNRASNAQLPPPSRSREDSGERPSRLGNALSQDAASVLSKQSSSPSLGNGAIAGGGGSSDQHSFESAMVSGHKEYLGRIGFGGLGRVIVFDTNVNHWREMAELTSLVVDKML